MHTDTQATIIKPSESLTPTDQAESVLGQFEHDGEAMSDGGRKYGTSFVSHVLNIFLRYQSSFGDLPTLSLPGS